MVPASDTPRAARKVPLACKRALASAPFCDAFVAPAFDEVLVLVVLVDVGVCKAESGEFSGIEDGSSTREREDVSYVQKPQTSSWSS